MKPNFENLNLNHIRAVPEILRSDPLKSKGRLTAEKPSFNRTEHERDRDRVIHSGAFRKLQYKTQVFVMNEGTYFRTRLTHTIEVTQIARTLSNCLNLNTPLTECVALSHDLGHTCFGHSGEDALNAVTQQWGGFRHNDQSLRIVTYLENNYPNFKGLNLTWESLEGLVKHNGPIKNPSQDLLDYSKIHDLELSSFASLEAQVAAISDDIAYNSHDIEDGIRSGLLDLDALKKLPLIDEITAYLDAKFGTLTQMQYAHQIKRYLTKFMIQDVLENSTKNIETFVAAGHTNVRQADHQLIAFSPKFVALDQTLRTHLKRELYDHATIYRMTNRANRAVQELFHLFLEDPKCLPNDWHSMLKDQSETQKVRIIADYIAGMTDKYAAREHQKLFGPIASFMG